METDPKMLREIANDDLTPKKHDFAIQKELHEKIRNDDDYDDWEYGTEPIPLTEFQCLNNGSILVLNSDC